MSMRSFEFTASAEGTRQTVPISQKMLFQLQSVTTSGKCSLYFDKLDEDDDGEDEKFVPFLVGTYLTPQTTFYNIPFTFNDVDFIGKGEGQITLVGSYMKNPDYVDFDKLDIIEEGFQIAETPKNKMKK